MRSLRVGLSAALFLALAVGPWGSAAAAEAIRVGFMGPLTGIFAQAGKDMLDGLKIALEQVGYQAGGRKIELIAEDTEGNAATALAKYRKLVDHDKIHVMTGILLVNVGNSLVPLIERDRLPTLFLTTPDDLTKRKIARWILRSNFSASQIMQPPGDYAARTLKYRRVATLVPPELVPAVRELRATYTTRRRDMDPALTRRHGLIDYLRARLAIAGTPEDCVAQVRAPRRRPESPVSCSR